MKTQIENGIVTLFLSGRVDSTNAQTTDDEISRCLAGLPHESLILDLSDLEYVSSAGLRIVLKLRKKYPELSLINVSSEVYDILDMTGFTEMIQVSKAFRRISIDGCEAIGAGANGIVYRIDRDTIVKVYKDSGALDDIRRERELARTAFIMGIPTAIPYDVVRVGETYGSVFELLNARSFAEILQEDSSNLEAVARESMKVAHIIHSLEAPANLPSENDVAMEWLGQIREYLSAEEYEKFVSLIDALSGAGTMIHGDFHIKNIMRQNGETLLIDMDTLSKGHPIFELAFMYNAYKGFGITDPGVIERFLGIGSDTACSLWRRSLEYYLDTNDPARLDEVEKKASLIGLLRVMRRPIEKGTADSEESRAVISACGDAIRKLLTEIDTLEF